MPKVSERESDEAGSLKREAKRSSAMRATNESEIVRQIPAQRRAGTPFDRTGFLTCFSKII